MIDSNFSYPFKTIMIHKTKAYQISRKQKLGKKSKIIGEQPDLFGENYECQFAAFSSKNQ